MTGTNMEKTKEGIVKLSLDQLTKLVTNWDNNGRTKGLLIMGPPGHGKTHLMTSLDWTETYPNKERATGNTTMHKVVELYEKHGNLEFMTNGLLGGIPNQKRYFDDLGSEPDAHHYGAVTNVMELIVDKFKGASYTTNLSLKDLTQKYGIRIVSRLKEHCIIVSLVDQDFRILNSALEIEKLINNK